jgi:hypothetical protein
MELAIADAVQRPTIKLSRTRTVRAYRLVLMTPRANSRLSLTFMSAPVVVNEAADCVKFANRHLLALSLSQLFWTP